MIEDDGKYDEFNDDEEETFSLSDIEIWYDNNLEYFIRNSTQLANIPKEIPLEVESFYYHVYLPVMHEAKPKILKLIHQQYPRIADELRPRFVKEAEKVADEAGHHLLMTLQAVIADQHSQANLYELYTDLPDWIQKYGKPEPPPEIDYHFMDKWNAAHQIPEEIIKEIAEENWREDLKFYYYNEARKKSYYDIFQTAIIKNYSPFLDFNLESWVIFAEAMFIDFLNYEEEIEYIDTMIDYGFAEEDFDLDYITYSEMLSERIQNRIGKEYKFSQNREDETFGE